MIAAAVAVAAAIIFAGLDPVILGSLVDFCLFVAGIRLWILRSLIFSYPIAFLLVTLGTLTSAALAALLFLLAFIYVHVTLEEPRRTELSAFRFAGLLILLVPVLLSVWYTPLPFFPEYPRTPGRIPLATAYGPVDAIDREFIRSFRVRFCLLLILFVPLAGWQLLRARNVRLLAFLAVLLLCVLAHRWR